MPPQRQEGPRDKYEHQKFTIGAQEKTIKTMYVLEARSVNPSAPSVCARLLSADNARPTMSLLFPCEADKSYQAPRSCACAMHVASLDTKTASTASPKTQLRRSHPIMPQLWPAHVVWNAICVDLMSGLSTGMPWRPQAGAEATRGGPISNGGASPVAAVCCAHTQRSTV